MSIEKAQAARASKYLDTLVRYHGTIITRRQLIRDRILVDDYSVVDRPIPDDAARRKAERELESMRRQWLPLGNECHPVTIRYNKLLIQSRSATKQEYLLMAPDKNWMHDLTKTGWVYAMSVIREHNLSLQSS